MGLDSNLEALRSLAKAGGSHFRTANEFVAEVLRGAIIQGVLKEGTALRQDDLAAAFGVSRIPVREALIQLEGEGLVDFVPHKGATVAVLSGKEVLEISEMRAVLEVLALKLSLPQLSERQLQECERILDEMDGEHDLATLCKLHRDFHLGLYAACGRTHLLALIESLEVRVERYFRFIVGPLSYGNQGQSEHRKLLHACAKRNLPQACQLLERHVLSAAEKFSVFLERQKQGDGKLPSMH